MIADIQEVLIKKESLEKRIAELGAEIERDYKGKTPIFVGILKGSAVFLADLIRKVDILLEVEFLKASSYACRTQSSGEVCLEEVHFEVKGRHILLIEDIVDTGNTLKFLFERFKDLKAEEVKICSLLNKPERREQEIIPDYIGFEIPNKFVVGYGLDYAQKYRNLPFIGVLKKEIYE